MAARIKVGVTSWADALLLRSGFYPPGVRNAATRLAYYASQFPLVENDAAYYALPDRRQAALWAQRTPPGFTMSFKAFAPLTGHYVDPRRLPPDLRGELSREAQAKAREKGHLYPHELGEPLIGELARRFREALAPLREAGKLGVLLFQFPVWFPRSRASLATLARLRGDFPDDRIAVEVRNATWLTERNRERTFAFLRDHGLLYVSVDEPQGFPSSVPPLAVATGELAVVRFHGQNRATWKRRARTAAERFAYRYTKEELRDWLPRIFDLAASTSEVHLLMNNCYADHGVNNARELMELVVESHPELLVRHSAAPPSELGGSEAAPA